MCLKNGAKDAVVKKLLKSSVAAKIFLKKNHTAGKNPERKKTVGKIL